MSRKLPCSILLLLWILSGAAYGEVGPLHGTVAHTAIEDGCWTFTTDQGETYELPGNSPSDLLQNGKRAVITGVVRGDLITTCQLGTPLEVSSFSMEDSCDRDGDGFPADNLTCGGKDCDDSDPGVHPGALEICGDGVDSDCNGTDSEKAASPVEPAVPCVSPDQASIRFLTEDNREEELELEAQRPGVKARISDAMVLDSREILPELPDDLDYQSGFLAFEAELPEGVDRITVRLSIPDSVHSPKLIKIMQDHIIREGEPGLEEVNYDPVNGSVRFVLKDNGPGDEDTRRGIVFDPIAIADERPARQTDSQGGGGCALGNPSSQTDLFPLLLPVLTLVIVRLRRLVPTS